MRVHLLASASRFLLLWMAVLAPLPLSALTKTINLPYEQRWSPPGIVGWGCGDLLPVIQNTTFTATFAGGLPTGSTVKNVKVTMPMRRYSSNFSVSHPVVDFSLAGVAIGSPTAVTGFTSCPLASQLTYYVFDQPFPNGLSGYNANGSNTLSCTIQGGVCDQYCGVTVLDRYGPAMTIEVTYDPPPPAEFAITSVGPEADRRILISNVRAGYSYPHFQAIGAQDAAVTTFLRARNAMGNFQSGLTVYMRILDPPDSAPYMNLPGNVIAQNNDNLGASAILDGPGVTAHTTAGVYQATSGANGQVDFTLRLLTPFAAGDNYQIEASLDPSFPAGGSAKSGILTAWKRVFIEKRRMLKNGLFLAQNANAGATSIITRGNKWGGNQSSVDDLSKNEKIVITHAPQINRSDLVAGWYYETHTIVSVVALSNDQYRVNLGAPLQNDFRIDQTDGRIGDGISKIDSLTLGATHYFDASPTLVTGEAFLDSFAENIYLPDTTTPGALVPVPFLETTEQDVLQKLADKWSSVVVNGALLPNHQLLIVAADNTPGPEVGTAAGVCISQVPGKTSSWVFRGSIQQQLPRNATLQADQWAMKTSAHEIAHQWRANGFWDPLDHCPATTKVYNDSNVYCLLADFDSNGSGTVTQRTNGVARFHLLPVPGGWHSEHLEIRRRSDPFQP